MNKLLPAILVAAGAASGPAAAEPSRFDQPVVMGPRWSPAISIPDNEYRPFFAFSGGGAVVLGLHEMASIEGELLYSIRSWSRLDLGPDVEEQISALTYLDAPLHARLQLRATDRVRVALLLGAQASILLFAIEQDERRDDRIVTRRISTSQLRRLVPAASGGLAAELDFSRLLFTLEGRLTRSLVSVDPDGTGPVLSTIGLMIGILF